jgi:hypothetical protein
MLAQQGADRHLADDVVQDTALKLLVIWQRVDTERPLWPLVRRIAFNCLVDRHRSRSDLPVEELPDRPAPYDVEEQGIARARLMYVREALGRLGKSERSALLAEVGSLPRPMNTSAAKMARLRARQKLSQTMDKIAAAFGLVPVAWRRFALWFETEAPQLHLVFPAAAGAATALSLVVLSVGPPPEPGRAASREWMDRAAAVNARFERRERAMPALERSRHAEARPQKALAPEPVAPDDPPTQPNETSADAGPTRVKTGGEGDDRYGAVCTGQDTSDEADDKGIYVGISHGEEEEEEPEDPC